MTYTIQLSIFALLFKCFWSAANKDKCLAKKVAKMYHEQKWFSLTVLLDIAYLKTMTFAFLQLRYPIWDSLSDKLSMFLAFTYMIVFTYYPIWMYKLVTQDF